jgi:large subunit ribosomal protein L40
LRRSRPYALSLLPRALHKLIRGELADLFFPPLPHLLSTFLASQQTLYENEPSEADRLAALAKVVPSAEAHDTILRAWRLHTRQKRESHAAELARKYSLMRGAIDLLEETSPELFKLATEGRKFQNVDQSRSNNARLEGLVPRELRVPTEQPGAQLFDMDWKAPAKVETAKR